MYGVTDLPIEELRKIAEESFRKAEMNKRRVDCMKVTNRVEHDLKPHNKATIEKILEFYKTSNKCCAIQATGTGKTFLILRLLEIYNDEGKVTVIFAPNNEIIKQTKKRMKKFGLNNATFYTYQKLARMTDEEISAMEFDLIVCDELHRTGAKTWGQKFEVLVNSHPESKVFGVTATPLRCADGRDMAEEYFDGNKACDINLAEALVREIIPVMPLYVSALYTFEEEYQNMSEKIEKANNSMGEKLELQKELLAAKQQLEKANGVPEIIKKYITNYNGKYLVFCKDKKHLYAMKDVVVGWFREAGYDGKIFEYPYYSCSGAVKKNFENFENNKEDGLKLLFIIDKLNEGLHLDEVHGCILLRTTVSNIIYYQQIGRAIDAGSMEQRVILDLVSNFNGLESFNFKKELEQKVKERRNGNFNDCSEEFELDKFDVVDLVQECVNVFNSIDERIHLPRESYSEKEIENMKKYYPTMGVKCRIYLNNRTDYSIRAMAVELGIKFIGNEWTKEDDDILYKYFEKIGTKCIKYLPNKNLDQIRYRAIQLGLREKRVSVKWTKDETEILINNVESDKLFELLPNKDRKQIKSKMARLGIRRIPKSSKYKYVSYCHGRYVVSFHVDNQRIYIGAYDDEDEAGRVAMEKAKEYGKAI